MRKEMLDEDFTNIAWANAMTCALAAAMMTLALICAAPGAFALSGDELERKVLEISEQLRCPTCQGISVRDSEAAFSRQIRDKVRSLLEEGKSEEEITAYFVSRYGEWILRAPKKEGIGLLLWVLPVAAIALAAVLLLWRLSRSARAVRAAPPAEPLSEAERGLIERDLRRFERGV